VLKNKIVDRETVKIQSWSSIQNTVKRIQIKLIMAFTKPLLRFFVSVTNHKNVS